MKDKRISELESYEKLSKAAEKKKNASVESLKITAKKKYGSGYNNIKTLKEYLSVNLDEPEGNLEEKTRFELIKMIERKAGKMPEVIVVDLPKKLKLKKK